MIRAIRSRLAAFLLMVGIAAIGPALSAAGEPALPPEGRLTYEVLRHGDRIGTQTFEFVHQDDRLVVRTHVNIKIDVMFFFTYRFRHDSEEHWVDGRLVALTSHTNDDGKKRTVELRREGDRLRGTYNGKARDLPATLLPASLWHPGTVRQSLLLDPIKGRSRRISVIDKGEERITLPEGAVPAHRYAITGQVERDVWYGPDGRLLQLRFSAKDDSKITVILRSWSPNEGHTATAPLSSGT